MDSDGVVVDEGRAPSDVTDEEIISWYKHMVSGIYNNWNTLAGSNMATQLA